MMQRNNWRYLVISELACTQERMCMAIRRNTNDSKEGTLLNECVRTTGRQNVPESLG